MRNWSTLRVSNSSTRRALSGGRCDLDSVEESVCVCGSCNDNGPCGICKRLIPLISGLEVGRVLDEGLVERMRSDLGNPGTSIRRVWSGIRKIGRKNKHMFPEAVRRQDRLNEPPAWRLSDEDIETLSASRFQGLPEALARRLGKGGVLPDGSHVSFVGDRFYLDGYELSLPYRGLEKMFRKHPKLCQEVPWRSLLRSLSLCTKPVRTREAARGVPNAPVLHPASPVVAGYLVNEVASQDPFWNLGRRLGRPRQNGNRRWYAGTEWLSLWDAERSGKTRGFEESYLRGPHILSERNGKLRIRVKRLDRYKKLEVESNPHVWMLLASWALSPPDHEGNLRLRILQQRMFEREGATIISASDTKGLRFLREVLDGNSRAHFDETTCTINVEGSSGLRYVIDPNKSGHNSRFSVFPVSREVSERGRRDWLYRLAREVRRDRAICISETRRLGGLVLGDSLATITMTLLDDITSSRQIDTLRRHLMRNRNGRADETPEQNQRRQAVELRARLLQNPFEVRRSRATEAFPALFSVLLRLPLGSRLTFTAMNPDRTPNLTFDDCNTTFRTSGDRDRRIVYAMLEASGWTREPDEERIRNQRRIYIRESIGADDLGDQVTGFARLLEDGLVTADGLRVVAGPVWRHFERANPGPGPLLPMTDNHLP